MVAAIPAHLGLPMEAPPIARARSPGFDITWGATYEGAAFVAVEPQLTLRFFLDSLGAPALFDDSASCSFAVAGS